MYNIYKNSRDASWKFLLEYGVSSLPLDLKKITSEMGVKVRRDNAGVLMPNELGITVNANGDFHTINEHFNNGFIKMYKSDSAG